MRKKSEDPFKWFEKLGGEPTSPHVDLLAKFSRDVPKVYRDTILVVASRTKDQLDDALAIMSENGIELREGAIEIRLISTNKKKLACGGAGRKRKGVEFHPVQGEA